MGAFSSFFEGVFEFFLRRSQVFLKRFQVFFWRRFQVFSEGVFGFFLKRFSVFFEAFLGSFQGGIWFFPDPLSKPGRTVAPLRV